MLRLDEKGLDHKGNSRLSICTERPHLFFSIQAKLKFTAVPQP